MGGPAETVAADIDHIRDIQEATGLHINASKCEIISHGSIPLAAEFEGFISLDQMRRSSWEAPLLRVKKMDELLANHCSELDIAFGRLSLLVAHDALILLKASFIAPNMLRCSGFNSAGFPVTKEPTGMFRTDGKRPDGLTLVPWQSGKGHLGDLSISRFIRSWSRS